MNKQSPLLGSLRWAREIKYVWLGNGIWFFSLGLFFGFQQASLSSSSLPPILFTFLPFFSPSLLVFFLSIPSFLFFFSSFREKCHLEGKGKLLILWTLSESQRFNWLKESELRETFFFFHLKKNDSEIVLAFAFECIGGEKVYNLLIKSHVGKPSATGSMGWEPEASLPSTCCMSLGKPPPQFSFSHPRDGGCYKLPWLFPRLNVPGV